MLHSRMAANADNVIRSSADHPDVERVGFNQILRADAASNTSIEGDKEVFDFVRDAAGV